MQPPPGPQPPKRKKKGAFIFSESLVEDILNRVKSGETIWSIAKKLAFPNSSWYDFVGEDSNLFRRFARAREIQAQTWADWLLEEARNEKVDTNRARLIVDTHRWLMSKSFPALYGELQRLEINDATDLVKLNIRERIAFLNARTAQLNAPRPAAGVLERCAQAKTVVEVAPVPPASASTT